MKIVVRLLISSRSRYKGVFRGCEIAFLSVTFVQILKILKNAICHNKSVSQNPKKYVYKKYALDLPVNCVCRVVVLSFVDDATHCLLWIM